MIHPENVEKTLEIYEYYDGPLSSLVLFKDGQKALVEVLNWSHKTVEMWQIAVIIESEEELKQLKEEKPLLKNLFKRKVEKNQAFLWYFKDRVCYVSQLNEDSVLEFTKDMSDEYQFEGSSEEWKSLLECSYG